MRRTCQLLILLPLLLLNGCSGFHDRSSINTIATIDEANGAFASIRGKVSHLVTTYDNSLLPEVPGQKVILMQGNNIIAETVTNIDGVFHFLSVIPKDSYLLRFPVQCWETSWHVGYSKRIVDFSINAKKGTATNVEVIIDCPGEPIAVD